MRTPCGLQTEVILPQGFSFVKLALRQGQGVRSASQT